jgi:hypothetical protein
MAGDHRKPADAPGTGERRVGLADRLLAVVASWSGMRRVLLLACLCVTIAGVSIAVISAAGGPANRVADVGTGQPSQTAAGQPSKNGHSSASKSQNPGGGASSAGRKSTGPHLPPRLRRQTLRWETGPGGRALATVEQHIGTAMQSAGLRLYSDMRSLCLTLTSDVGKAQAAPPIPNAARQRTYSRALAGIANAAADCRLAISIHAAGDEDVEIHVNKALLTRTRREFAAMSGLLYLATRDIRLLTS